MIYFRPKVVFWGDFQKKICGVFTENFTKPVEFV